MPLLHMGCADRNELSERAPDLCTTGETAMPVGYREGQHSAAEMTEYLMETIRKLKAQA